MVIYGIYGILLVSGLIVLLVVAQGRLSEASAKHQSQLVLPYFVLVVVFFLTLLNVFPGLYGNFPVLVFIFGTLVVGLVILTVWLMVKAELDRGKAEKKVARGLIEKHAESLKEDPSDFGSHAGLARAYEKKGEYELAAAEYDTAAGLCSEDAKKYAQRLERMADVMRKLGAAEEAKRTYPCPECASRNRPLERLCSECGEQLYGNTVRWAWMNTSMATRIAALAVVVLSSLFMIKLPVTYSLTLMGVWLALVVYFSLPWEKFVHI
jgi:hypothetical protein